MTAEQKAFQPMSTIYITVDGSLSMKSIHRQDAWDDHALVASQYLPGQEMEVAH